MKIFVGHLPSETTGDDLRQAFESFGQVGSVTIAVDRTTGASRGFAFVIMPVADEARNAIEKMNGKDLQGRKIDVEKGRTKTKPRGSRHQLSHFANGGQVGRHRGRRRY
ncbi:MAG: hypothetical protein PVJ86_10835 [Phycisphaerales bacterium]|jgi:RNA recognition motif-containing protein